MTALRSHAGACHCRAVGFTYRTTLDPKQWSVRACQCSFCRAHAALTASDAQGALEFIEQEPDCLRPYRFGQRTADFLVCSRCGVYLGAAMRSERGYFGIINTRALSSLPQSLPDPVPMNYEGETVAERAARREERWTPLRGLTAFEAD